jgi:hypothetical protein
MTGWSSARSPVGAGSSTSHWRVPTCWQAQIGQSARGCWAEASAPRIRWSGACRSPTSRRVSSSAGGVPDQTGQVGGPASWPVMPVGRHGLGLRPIRQSPGVGGDSPRRDLAGASALAHGFDPTSHCSLSASASMAPRSSSISAHSLSVRRPRTRARVTSPPNSSIVSRAHCCQANLSPRSTRLLMAGL